MKKQLFLLLSALITYAGMAQVPLTKAQVHDFNIGDVMQIECFHPIYPTSTYETRTIVGKTWSFGNDTIFYTVQLDYYTPPPPACGTCTPVYSSSSRIDTITNLGDIADHHNQTNLCFGTVDSFYVDTCNRNVWEQTPGPAVGCPATSILENTWMVQGLGGPYYLYTTHPAIMSLPWVGYRLTWSLKNGDSCGVYVASLKDLSEIVQQTLLYPNPAAGQLQIKSADLYYYYDIMNLHGRVLSASPLNKGMLDISFLSQGVYVLNLYMKKGKVEHYRFVKD